MINRRRAIFLWTGIVMSAILVFIIVDTKTDMKIRYGENSSPQNLSILKEQNMSEALEQQTKILSNIIDKGNYISDNFSYYDISYIKKLSNEIFEVEISGAYEDVNTVRGDVCKFNIRTAELKDSENMDSILNMTRDALKGLLAKESNLPDVSKDYSIIYFNDFGQGEYEFGIETKGKQYYFLLENYSRFTPQGRWAVLGWSEGSIPDDWNDLLAVQHYASTNHSSLGEQEYEQFFAAYADNIYKLMDENSKLIADREKYNGWTFDSNNYGLISGNGKLLFEEAEKVMKIGSPDKYDKTHSMLVNAMYRVRRLASVYVEGSEGYLDETDYMINRWYEYRAVGARDILNKAYACYETEKLDEAFDENKYNKTEEANKVEITRLIDVKINKYTKLRAHAHPSVGRANNTQYRYYTDEGSATNYKRVFYTFEKDKDGKWMIVSRTEQN